MNESAHFPLLSTVHLSVSNRREKRAVRNRSDKWATRSAIDHVLKKEFRSPARPRTESITGSRPTPRQAAPSMPIRPFTADRMIYSDPIDSRKYVAGRGGAAIRSSDFMKRATVLSAMRFKIGLASEDFQPGGR